MGDELPIVASLDYHANLTPDMARLATALVGYRTYPHIDMAVTGKRARSNSWTNSCAKSGRSIAPTASSTS